MDATVLIVAYPTDADRETRTNEIGRIAVSTPMQFDDAVEIYRQPARFLDFRHPPKLPRPRSKRKSA